MQDSRYTETYLRVFGCLVLFYITVASFQIYYITLEHGFGFFFGLEFVFCLGGFVVIRFEFFFLGLLFFLGEVVCFANKFNHFLCSRMQEGK